MKVGFAHRGTGDQGVKTASFDVTRQTEIYCMAALFSLPLTSSQGLSKALRTRQISDKSGACHLIEF